MTAFFSFHVLECDVKTVDNEVHNKDLPYEQHYKIRQPGINFLYHAIT